MNFDLYFAEQVLNGIKKVEIRDKPQEVNKWIPIVVNGETLGEMVLENEEEQIFYILSVEYNNIYKKNNPKYELQFPSWWIDIDKPHFDFYSQYFTGEPIYIYNIKEVRRF
jgi:hypothetical protein